MNVLFYIQQQMSNDNRLLTIAVNTLYCCLDYTVEAAVLLDILGQEHSGALARNFKFDSTLLGQKTLKIL